MAGISNIDLPDGITYRQWLIGMALQGLLSGDVEDKLSASGCATAALRYADAVIAKLIAEEYVAAETVTNETNKENE
ncbi:TPA: hypothetical protein ACTVL7_001459 [Escherichia coli]|uniref:hypothetical protein n=1 Tax=Escherichia coli TaxID=562 RepID=UPI0015FB2FEE|nr:hypothetical protein [Escherichia coli]EFB1308970.1 hypothetical protein [Escherichia coli]MCB6152453.1 hypothetical protein [Escherichia coli]MCX3733539.1 hypothetical protein [Escherichia coli]MDA6496754.1 hypothetical protein [Escherichia coli]HCD2549745.1 hypothetical protein [Escherichia coli]